MKLREILGVLRDWAPESLQESYDNSGLIVGQEQWEIHKAIISLDCTEQVVDEAISQGANLVISHHPIVFSGIKRFNGQSYVERVVEKAIKNDIALYAIHTNLDNVSSGVNLEFSKRLGLQNLNILLPKQNALRKLCFFVPVAQIEDVRNALFDGGAGEIGNYSECSFSVLGKGTFKAGDAANPYVGKAHVRHEEEEARVELIYPYFLERSLLNKLNEVHPYEEVAYDVYEVQNAWQEVGSGMVGNLPEPEYIQDFLQRVKDIFGAGVVRHTQPLKDQVQRIAVCGGAGSFLLQAAKKAQADVFITSDYKYHQFFDADNQIVIADIGHYESEKFTMHLIKEYLSENLTNFATCLTQYNTNPVTYL